MGKKKRMPGLYQRNGYWHIDKVIRGKRFRGSCSTKEVREAEAYLAHIIWRERMTEDKKLLVNDPVGIENLVHDSMVRYKSYRYCIANRENGNLWGCFATYEEAENLIEGGRQGGAGPARPELYVIKPLKPVRLKRIAEMIGGA